jgi:hypothetical protein
VVVSVVVATVVVAAVVVAVVVIVVVSTVVVVVVATALVVVVAVVSVVVATVVIVAAFVAVVVSVVVATAVVVLAKTEVSCNTEYTQLRTRRRTLARFEVAAVGERLLSQDRLIISPSLNVDILARRYSMQSQTSACLITSPSSASKLVTSSTASLLAARQPASPPYRIAVRMDHICVCFNLRSPLITC